jgi:hypothetical protein
VLSRLSDREAAAVDAAVRLQMERQGGIVGVAVGVIEGNEIAYLRGYGAADREAGTPVTVDTRFRWASISKCVTAVAALQLAEAGRLDLDADVRGYVPEYPEGDKARPITCRHLLCHQSGIGRINRLPAAVARRSYPTPRPFADVVTALDTFKENAPLFPPGAGRPTRPRGLCSSAPPWSAPGASGSRIRSGVGSQNLWACPAYAPTTHGRRYPSAPAATGRAVTAPPSCPRRTWT